MGDKISFQNDFNEEIFQELFPHLKGQEQRYKNTLTIFQTVTSYVFNAIQGWKFRFSERQEKYMTICLKDILTGLHCTISMCTNQL